MRPGGFRSAQEPGALKRLSAGAGAARAAGAMNSKGASTFLGGGACDAALQPLERFRCTPMEPPRPRVRPPGTHFEPVQQTQEVSHAAGASEVNPWLFVEMPAPHRICQQASASWAEWSRRVHWVPSDAEHLVDSNLVDFSPTPPACTAAPVAPRNNTSTPITAPTTTFGASRAARCPGRALLLCHLSLRYTPRRADLGW